jgi:hypothetical protein
LRCPCPQNFFTGQPKPVHASSILGDDPGMEFPAIALVADIRPEAEPVWDSGCGDATPQDGAMLTFQLELDHAVISE